MTAHFTLAHAIQSSFGGRIEWRNVNVFGFEFFLWIFQNKTNLPKCAASIFNFLPEKLLNKVLIISAQAA